MSEDMKRRWKLTLLITSQSKLLHWNLFQIALNAVTSKPYRQSEDIYTYDHCGVWNRKNVCGGAYWDRYAFWFAKHDNCNVHLVSPRDMFSFRPLVKYTLANCVYIKKSEKSREKKVVGGLGLNSWEMIKRKKIY